MIQAVQKLYPIITAAIDREQQREAEARRLAYEKQIEDCFAYDSFGDSPENRAIVQSGIDHHVRGMH